jgi:hypothetical protein
MSLIEEVTRTFIVCIVLRNLLTDLYRQFKIKCSISHLNLTTYKLLSYSTIYLFYLFFNASFMSPTQFFSFFLFRMNQQFCCSVCNLYITPQARFFPSCLLSLEYFFPLFTLIRRCYSIHAHTCVLISKLYLSTNEKEAPVGE